MKRAVGYAEARVVPPKYSPKIPAAISQLLWRDTMAGVRIGGWEFLLPGAFIAGQVREVNPAVHYRGQAAC